MLRETDPLASVGRMDHSTSSEYRILGPPGTGKTTSTATLVRQSAKTYGSEAVMVTSFSRAAAAELANCDLPIPPECLGTLHSICFHALGRPRIAEAHVQDWNRRHSSMAITSVNRQSRLDGEDALEDATNARHGDSLLQSLNCCRGLMIEPAHWPVHVREFERQWSKYKRELRLLDFCDLIEHCLLDVAVAPGSPAVIFADEAQDLNTIQARLLRKWGKAAEYFVLAGDDDQTIYSFLGASPDALLEPSIPDDHVVVLSQSHRVSRAIHRFANELIRNVTRRHPKVYAPRDVSGSVEFLSTASYKSPEYSILSSAIKHLEKGQNIMLLASCSYMLQPLIQVLRKNGIPFHNPYRRANGYWNPLQLGHKTAARRILALLTAHPNYGEGQHSWTHGDLLLWTEWLPPDVFKNDAQKLLSSAGRHKTVTPGEIQAIFEERTLATLLSTFERDWRALLDWWCSRIRPEFRNRVQFPAVVAAKHSPQSLTDDPQIVVGTIHSVKGGQADVVYLFPDLSRAGYKQYDSPGQPRDPVIRLFYVGVTRARHTLYICQRESATAIRL